MKNLKKQLSFIDVFSLAAGAMISSGIFILPGLAFNQAGPAMIFSYMIAGILALAGVLSIAELSTAMPKAGGDYYFVNRSMGPMFGTISGVMSWFALSLKTSFAIFGIAEVLFLLTGINVRLIGIVISLAFMIINIIGVKEAAKLEVKLVLILLLLIVVYILFGFTNVNIKHFESFSPHGFHSVLMTSAFVFVSFGGLLNISSVSEEVINPKKNIPLGLITAVLTVTSLYALLLFVTVGVLPASKLSNTLTPLADAAKNIFGQSGYFVMTIAGLIAFITTANAGIMSASRYPIALSRDQLLPEWISTINPRFKTPIISVLVTGGFIILSLFLPLEILVKAASTVVLTSYVLANISIIILRESQLQNYRPTFKAPLYPWIQIISSIIFIFMIIDMGKETVEISVSLITIALLLYFLYGMKRANSEYAWLHLIARFGNEELDSYDLESELKGILHHRDNIVHDRFDDIIHNASVIDIESSSTKDDLFEMVAESLQTRIPAKKDKIIELLHERENLSCTALIPFVAIPHIMIKGENCFDIMIIRSQKGIYFCEEAPKVKAIFVIAGTKDERRLHLQALAAIAQVTHSHDFEKFWIDARNENHLKDIFLLSQRKRF